MAWIQERRWAGGAKAAWQIREKSPSSGKVVVIKTFKTEREAKKFLQSGEAAADRITPADARRLTVADIADRWLDAREKGTDGAPPVTPATLRNYQEVTRLHVRPLIGGRLASTFSRADAKEYRRQLLATRSRMRSQTAIRRVFAMFEHHIDAFDLKTRNPFLGIVIELGERPERVMPTHDQVRALLDRAVTLRSAALATSYQRQAWLRYTPMVWMMALLGPRTQEVRGAVWPDIDLDTGTWSIQHAVDRFNNLKAPKTRKGRRTLLLSPEIVSMLRDWRRHCPDGQMNPNNLVFPTRHGRPISQPQLDKNVWRVLMGECGFVDAEGKGLFCPYSLRHFKLSDDIMQGDDIKTIQRRSGHARAATLLDIYGKTFDRRAAEGDRQDVARLTDALRLSGRDKRRDTAG